MSQLSGIVLGSIRYLNQEFSAESSVKIPRAWAENTLRGGSPVRFGAVSAAQSGEFQKERDRSSETVVAAVVGDGSSGNRQRTVSTMLTTCGEGTEE